MITLEELANDEQVKKEYIKAVLLTMFKKICIKMEKNEIYKDKIRKLFRETHNKIMTSKLLIEREFDVSLSYNESFLLSKWFSAYLRKKTKRNSKFTNIEVKKILYTKQNGICASCGEMLGNDYSKIHVDHIIPFVLVGDELDDNYQDLCETCNECKSAKVDYIFKRLVKLI